EALIEHDLRRHARVGAAENDRKGLLRDRHLAAAALARERIVVALRRDETRVAFPQPLQSFSSRDHAFEPLVRVSAREWSCARRSERVRRWRGILVASRSRRPRDRADGSFADESTSLSRAPHGSEILATTGK